ncbi:uncharacterized protein SCHCODRAFT_02257348 [Schizophyllum commune H4-8]|uniref:uncharacterized protein n=1 Tax=Schizophyllum commune (strain H4-8 / FGSC 9210) TaxID=578458 RepID=UPI00215FBF74|nr:uncharacterized protein SCHCODRAFT_02257348 [Schizophyllum commune H4-8]KAI5893617.1 hypothetical protein SCHCODRAFT_02257348 [Schizophyllum commune H4-8]
MHCNPLSPALSARRPGNPQKERGACSMPRKGISGVIGHRAGFPALDPHLLVGRREQDCSSPVPSCFRKSAIRFTSYPKKQQRTNGLDAVCRGWSCMHVSYLKWARPFSEASAENVSHTQTPNAVLRRSLAVASIQFSTLPESVRPFSRGKSTSHDYRYICKRTPWSSRIARCSGQPSPAVSLKGGAREMVGPHLCFPPPRKAGTTRAPSSLTG